MNNTRRTGMQIITMLLVMLILIILSACNGDTNYSYEETEATNGENVTVASENPGVDDVETESLTSQEILDMYADSIQVYLDNPDVFFQSMDHGEHAISYDSNQDGVPEFIELGYGSSYPYTSTVFKYVNGEVIKIPEKVEDVLSWADMQTPVLFYFNQKATKFMFYSWDENRINNDDSDPRLLTIYTVDSYGGTDVEKWGTQLYGTGADPTGENTYTTNDDAEQMERGFLENGDFFWFPWGTEGDIPSSVKTSFGVSSDETITFLNSIGVSVH